MTSRYLSIREAAERLEIHPRTLRRWCAQGAIGHVRTHTGRLMLAPHQIDEWEQAHTIRRAQHHAEVDTPNPLYRPDDDTVIPMRRRPA